MWYKASIDRDHSSLLSVSGRSMLEQGANVAFALGSRIRHVAEGVWGFWYRASPLSQLRLATMLMQVKR